MSFLSYAETHFQNAALQDSSARSALVDCSSAAQALQKKSAQMTRLVNADQQNQGQVTSGKTVQLFRKIHQNAQTVNFNAKNYTVGGNAAFIVEATDKIFSGTNASENTDDPHLLATAIREKYSYNPCDVVKQHLYSYAFGGDASNANLYPASKAANGLHTIGAERDVVNRHANHEDVYYTVSVKADSTNPERSFWYATVGTFDEPNNSVKNMNEHTWVSDLTNGSPHFAHGRIEGPDKNYGVLYGWRHRPASMQGMEKPAGWYEVDS